MKIIFENLFGIVLFTFLGPLSDKSIKDARIAVAICNGLKFEDIKVRKNIKKEK